MKFATAETRIVTAAEFPRSFLPAPMIGIGQVKMIVFITQIGFYYLS